MSESKSEVNIIMVANKLNQNVFLLNTELQFNNKIKLLAMHYKSYMAKQQNKSRNVLACFTYITENGGLDNVMFARIGTHTINNKDELEEIIKTYVQKAIVDNKIVCNPEHLTKHDHFKKYYEENKEAHKLKVKQRYEENKEAILQKKKEKETVYKHCSVCDLDVISNNYKKHCLTKTHISKYQELDNYYNESDDEE